MEIAWNFATYLTIATIVCGILVAIDKFFLKPRRLIAGSSKQPWLIEQACAFFPVLLVVLLLRSFLLEPFRIPSASMKPGLLEGDFIAVNKFTYGLRLPVVRSKVLSLGEPKRGDVIVFHAPFNLSQDFIKRVVGLPGDVIAYQDKMLYINGEPQQQNFLSIDYDIDLKGESVTVQKYEEFFNHNAHDIFMRKNKLAENISAFRVPEGHYFVMGDNRDNSADSRMWGFVPESYIVGRADVIWMSWDALSHRIRFKRIGTHID